MVRSRKTKTKDGRWERDVQVFYARQRSPPSRILPGSLSGGTGVMVTTIGDGKAYQERGSVDEVMPSRMYVMYRAGRCRRTSRWSPKK